MSRLVLIRHGQAGSRRDYDALSELGRTQSRLLGDYLAAQKLHLTAVYSGALRRQRESAEEACRAYRRTGQALPEMVIDPRWNEFDLGKVLEEFAPRLSAEDPQFQREYQELLRSKHRYWTRCDMEAVRAWIEDRYPFDGESWRAFCSRTGQCLSTLSQYGSGQAIAIFTSATPIAVWVSMALALAGGKVMQLAGALYNSSITTLRLHEGELTLFTFNTVPHLSPDLLTFR